MSAQFTPAPWTLTDESHLTPDEPYWIGAEHPEVGRCTFAIVRSGCDEADEMGDLLANARLIAAAPELYEALRECRVALMAIEDSAVEAGFGKLGDIIADRLAKANLAIDKADGETSE